MTATTSFSLAEIAQNHTGDARFIQKWIAEGYEGNFHRHDLSAGVICYLDTDNCCVVYIYENAGTAEPTISSDGNDVDAAYREVSNACTQHGGRRPGAGRKPDSFKGERAVLALLKSVEKAIRAQDWKTAKEHSAKLSFILSMIPATE